MPRNSFESHNDFDSNGGAFYNYLIQNEYNKKYKIVWLIKHKESLNVQLPKNVAYVMQYNAGRILTPTRLVADVCIGRHSFDLHRQSVEQLIQCI